MEKDLNERNGNLTPETKGLTDHEQQIDRLLSSDKPCFFLKVICKGIPQRTSREKMEELRLNKQFIELTYFYLPTLKTTLDFYRNFGILEKDLFDTAFFTMQSCLLSWNPEEKSNSEETQDLKSYVSNGMRRTLEHLIVERYGLVDVHDFPVVKLYRDCWLEFIQEKGHTPTFSEINEYVREKNTNILELNFRFSDWGRGSSYNKIELIFLAMQEVSYNDEVNGELGEQSLEDSVLGGNKILGRDIRRALMRLDPQERTFLKLRYGINLVKGGSNKTGELTLEEVARIFKIDVNAAKQIEAKALRRLRNPSISRKLGDYL